MALIELTNVLFYKSGTSGVSAAVGYESSSRRVARYTFVAPEIGAQSVSLVLRTAGRQNGSHIPIRFYIGTDPESHANAGVESEYTGVLTIEDNWVVFTGSADIVLTPNQTYYLWIFPGEDTYGWYSWQDKDDVSTLETFGAAGLVYIDNGKAFEPYLIYIDNGTGWDLYMPYIDNGTSWDLYS